MTTQAEVPNLGAGPWNCNPDGTPKQSRFDLQALDEGATCPIDGGPVHRIGSMINTLLCVQCGYAFDLTDMGFSPGQYPFTPSMFLGYAQTKMQDFAPTAVGETAEFAKTWDLPPREERRNEPTPLYGSVGLAAPVDASPMVAGVPPGHPASYVG